MSSTHIQFDRDSVVSVQTQSITARSSTRNGTRRNLHTHTHTLSIYIMLSIYYMMNLEMEIKKSNFSSISQHICLIPLHGCGTARLGLI